MGYLRHNGNTVDDYALLLEAKLNEISDQLLALGWVPIGSDYYERLDKRNEEALQLLQQQHNEQ